MIGILQNVSTLIFDLDGTISDPILGIYRCINHALRYYGFSEVSVELVPAEIGPPLDETFNKFKPGADQSVVANLVSKYRERYAEIGYSENEIYPGLAGALQALSDGGVRMGVCTSKRKDFAEKSYIGSEALAAIDTVTRPMGKPGISNSYTETVDKWVEEQKPTVSQEILDKSSLEFDHQDSFKFYFSTIAVSKLD
jgi:hypothetical protein